MVIAFIVLAGLLVYAWLVYPAVMLAIGRRRLQGSGFRVQEGAATPPVAILFSAHNEEAVILKRLENLAALDYPAARLRILVGIDGGTDRTAEIALEWAKSHANVHVILSPDNHGKMAMLKRLAESVGSGQGAGSRDQEAVGRGQGAGGSSPADFDSSCSLPTAPCLLVFTDANTFFAPDALTRLVAPFSDPKVGGVCGRLIFVQTGKTLPRRHGEGGEGEEEGEQTGEENAVRSFQMAGTPFEKIAPRRSGGGLDEAGIEISSSLLPSSLSPSPLRASVVKSSSPDTDETVYWNWETRLKEAESGLDSCLGANGAIYAIRSGLFPAGIPDNTVVDDFVIGMKVREQGYRMVFEPSAVAMEDLPETVQGEWRRRVRIGAGAFQALALCRSCLSPRYGLFAWMFWSHKVLRWFTPHLLLVVTGLLSCWVGGLFSGNPGTQASTTQQLNNLTTGFLLLAVVLVFGLLTKQGRKGLRLLAYFVTIQAALFAGFLRYCRGGLKGTWERTERGGLHH